MQMCGVIPFINLLNLLCVWIEGRELNLNASSFWLAVYCVFTAKGKWCLSNQRPLHCLKKIKNKKELKKKKVGLFHYENLLQIMEKPFFCSQDLEKKLSLFLFALLCKQPQNGQHTMYWIWLTAILLSAAVRFHVLSLCVYLCTGGE